MQSVIIKEKELIDFNKELNSEIDRVKKQLEKNIFNSEEEKKDYQYTLEFLEKTKKIAKEQLILAKQIIHLNYLYYIS